MEDNYLPDLVEPQGASPNESVQRTVSNPPVVANNEQANIKPRKAIKNQAQLMPLLSEQVPKGMMMGQAYDQGDCFFDALAQLVNRLNKTDINTDKYLRTLCHDFYSRNKELVDKWISEDFGGIDSRKDEYSMVQYTADECDELLHGRTPIWGRPYVEGKILCRQLQLEAICVIEILEDFETKKPVISFHLINNDSYTSISEVEAKQWISNSKVPTLVVEQNSLHFVPLINSVNNNQKTTTAQFDEHSSPNSKKRKDFENPAIISPPKKSKTDELPEQNQTNSDSFEELAKKINTAYEKATNLIQEFEEYKNNFLGEIKATPNDADKWNAYREKFFTFLQEMISLCESFNNVSFEGGVIDDSPDDYFTSQFTLPNMQMNYHRYKGVKFVTESKFEQAKAEFEQAIALDEKNPELKSKPYYLLEYYYAVLVEYRLKQYDNVIKMCPAIEDNQADDLLAESKTKPDYASHLFCHLANFSDAIVADSYLEFSHKFSLKSEFYYYRALAHEKLSQLEAHRVNLCEAYYLRGRDCQVMGHYEIAEQWFTKALELEKKQIRLFMARANVRFITADKAALSNVEADFKAATNLAVTALDKLNVLNLQISLWLQLGRVDKLKYFANQMLKLKAKGKTSTYYYLNANYNLFLVEACSDVEQLSPEMLSDYINELSTFYFKLESSARERILEKIYRIFLVLARLAVRCFKKNEIEKSKACLVLATDFYKKLIKDNEKFSKIRLESGKRFFDCVFGRLYCQYMSRLPLFYVSIMKIIKQDSFTEIKTTVFQLMNEIPDKLNNSLFLLGPGQVGLALENICLLYELVQEIEPTLKPFPDEFRNQIKQISTVSDQDDANINTMEDRLVFFEKAIANSIDKDIKTSYQRAKESIVISYTPTNQYEATQLYANEQATKLYELEDLQVAVYLDLRFTRIILSLVKYTTDKVKLIIQYTDELTVELDSYETLINQEKSLISKTYKLTALGIFKKKFFTFILNSYIEFIEKNEVTNVQEILVKCDNYCQRLQKINDSTWHGILRLEASITNSRMSDFEFELKKIESDKIQREYQELKRRIVDHPLAVFYGKRALLIPFRDTYLKETLREARRINNIAKEVNISAHAITLVYSKVPYTEGVKTELVIKTWILKDEKGSAFLANDQLKQDSLSKILSRVQKGWDIINGLSAGEKARFHFFEKFVKPSKAGNDLKHSEQHFFQYLNDLGVESFIEKFKKDNPDFLPGCKVYMLAFDMVSDRESCERCLLSEMAEQSLAENNPSFVKSLQVKLLNDGYYIAGNKSNNNFLKTVTRVLAFSSKNHYTNPAEKNVKKLNNLGIFMTTQPTPAVSGSSRNMTQGARNKFK